EVDGGFPSHSAGDVYALRVSNGSLLWHYTVKGACCRSLVVTNTAIYVGQLDNVDALKTSDGTVLWHRQIDSPNVLVGLAAVDGVVYVGTALVDYSGPPKGPVDALRAADGTLIWQSRTNIASTVLPVAAGRVVGGASL